MFWVSGYYIFSSPLRKKYNLKVGELKKENKNRHVNVDKVKPRSFNPIQRTIGNQGMMRNWRNSLPQEDYTNQLVIQ